MHLRTLPLLLAALSGGVVPTFAPVSAAQSGPPTIGASTSFGGGTAIAPGGRRRILTTYVTGATPTAEVVFRVRLDPAIALSGVVTIAVTDPRGITLDGIDFVPGTHGTEVVVGSPSKVIAHYDVVTGAVLPDYVPHTDLIAAPPAGAGTWPSTVVSTPTHVYYIENQFGFGATASHRIMRKPFGGGPESIVFDGAFAGGLKNFEGLEGVAGRLFFFGADPGDPGARALLSIGISMTGVWNGMSPLVEIGGLFKSPMSKDGSDELDFDPVTGLLFGTNIINGEVIAFDPFLGVEVSSPGAMHFIDGMQVAGSTGNLSLLGLAIDGIRSAGEGHLVVSGKGGVILSIDVGGVLGDGADDGDVLPIVYAPGVLDFDDLTALR
ncbi:MAG: hypothetical protein K8S98_09460 [Planctomycetes bacterium]|nr:hypothetical protein [Planctomycetota bacterium]